MSLSVVCALLGSSRQHPLQALTYTYTRSSVCWSLNVGLPRQTVALGSRKHALLAMLLPALCRIPGRCRVHMCGAPQKAVRAVCARQWSAVWAQSCPNEEPLQRGQVRAMLQEQRSLAAMSSHRGPLHLSLSTTHSRPPGRLLEGCEGLRVQGRPGDLETLNN